MDDFASDISTTGRIEPGGSVTGTIDGQGDRDWFAISLQEGTAYRFDLKGAPSGQGTLLDPFLGLYDADGTLLEENDDAGGSLESRIAGFTPAASGTFFLSAEDFGFSGSSSYTLFAEVLIDTVGDEIATSTPLTLGQAIAGRLESSADVDVFAIRLDAGLPVRIDATSQDANPAIRFEVLDASGVVLLAADNENSFSAERRANFTPESSGEFFIRTQSFEDIFGPTLSNFTLLVQSVAAVNLIGSDGAETLTGGLGDDALSGLGGDDWLVGADGDDTILGGDGRDSIAGGAGRDSIDSGAGDDIIGAGQDADTVFGGDGDDGIRAGQGNDFVSGGEGADRMSGGAGRDILLGGNGNDVIGAGFDADLVYAGRGNDSVGGGSGDDILFLGAGNDTAFGGSGNDRIDGGVGDDLIFGGPGNDTLSGGAGNDTLTGGQSSDVFVFNTFTAGEIDTITDFNPIALNTSAFFTPPSSRLQFHIGVDLDELDPLTAFASLDISDADAGATITIAGHIIILEGVFAADISVGDFIFL